MKEEKINVPEGFTLLKESDNFFDTDDRSFKILLTQESNGGYATHEYNKSGGMYWGHYLRSYKDILIDFHTRCAKFLEHFNGTIKECQKGYILVK